MSNKKFILFSAFILVFLGVFAAAGSALATGQVPCGASDNTIYPGLTVKKTVFCSIVRDWDWKIEKVADLTSLILSPGQSIFVNYDVFASATATSAYGVSGQIVLINTTSAPIAVASVSDSLAPVKCPQPFPFSINPGGNAVCTYEGTISDAAPQNTATAIDVAGNSYVGVAPIDWHLATVTETDECATITDSLVGTLGTVCAGQNTSFTFNYSHQIGPFDTCGYYEVPNIASFETNDTGTTGSDTETVVVNVPCGGACSLTPGYWKTHSEFGPAPYDDTWAQLANGASTPFFLSGQTYYQALWTSPNGNAYYILAHAYIAAQLNFLNGADPSAAQAAFDSATALFQVYTPAQIGALRGSSALRHQFVSLAGILDDYNNGLIGPGHCTE